MEDDSLTNENCSGKEHELSSCQLAGNHPIPAESIVTESPIGGELLDVSSNECNEKMVQNLAEEETDQSGAPNVLTESGRIFARRDSEGQPQSKSFKRLQDLLQEEKDVKEEGPFTVTIIIVIMIINARSLTYYFLISCLNLFFVASLYP